MSSESSDGDRMIEWTLRLPMYDPDPRRAKRTLARCHAALKGRPPGMAGEDGDVRPSGWGSVHLAAVAASVAYLVDVALRAFILHIR